MSERARLQSYRLPMHDGETALARIELRDGTLVGTIKLTQARHETVYIAWYAVQSHEGRGHIRAAVREMMPTLFEFYHRVVAVIEPRNHRSRAVAAAVGLRHEGTALRSRWDGTAWRDQEFWARTVEEYGQ